MRLSTVSTEVYMAKETLRALLVVTSVDKTPAGTPTGYWFEELAAPYYAFYEGGCDVSFASIKGGRPPRDPLSESDDWQTEATRRFSGEVLGRLLIQEEIKLHSPAAACVSALRMSIALSRQR